MSEGGVKLEHNRIEQEVFIAAPLDEVWPLVSEPAWWVGDGPGPDRVNIQGNRVVAETAKYGTFPVLIDQTEAPRYLACRWASSFPGEEPSEGNSTLVAFRLSEEIGGTRVRVIESGFAHLAVSQDEQQRAFNENAKGWAQQLGVLRQRAEQSK